AVVHGTPVETTPLSWRFILPSIALLALAAGLWRLRQSMIARFAVCWFAVNMLPVLNLSAFGEDFLVQERYVYISSIGFSLLLALALLKIPLEKWIPIGTRRLAQTALVALLVLLLSGKSLAQHTICKDEMTLWD